MVEKLRLPFPLLADPGGAVAIKPYGVWHDEPSLARPALVLVTPDGQEAFRRVSRDYADRLPESEVVAVAEGLGLGPVIQDAPEPGDPRPGERAFPVDAFNRYFRGVRFAALALAGRVPEAQQEAAALVAEAERYTQAAKSLRA